MDRYSDAIGQRLNGCLPTEANEPAPARDLSAEAEVIAHRNRTRAERLDRLRAEVGDLATEALATLRGFLKDPETPPAVRLRAALAVLDATEALKPQPIGSANPKAVRAELGRRQLFENLGV